MPNVIAYHRPATLADAVALVGRPSAVVIGGGTRFNAHRSPTPAEVVDLQALGLAGIDVTPDGRARLGATTTLDQVAGDDRLPTALRDACRRDAPSSLRTIRTIGGCVATREASSELLAVLLVCEASVHVVDAGGDREIGLAALLADPLALHGSMITAIDLATAGPIAAARAGRTVADQPIVAAVARRLPEGRVLTALSGVAPTPIIVADLGDLDPPGDFRGSAEYRRALAKVLTARVLEEVA